MIRIIFMIVALTLNTAIASDPIRWDFSGSGGTHLLFDGNAVNGKGILEVFTEASSTPYLSIQAAKKFDLFGVARSSAGDFNSDGYDDIIVGAPLFGSEYAARSGSAYVFSGATGERLFKIIGFKKNNFLGRAVSGVGDIDLDGSLDLIISGWVHPENGVPYGRVYIVSGSTGKIIHTVTSFEAGDGFGFTVVSLGDLSGDGVHEFAISAPLASTNYLSNGAVYLFDPSTFTKKHVTTMESYSTIYNSDVTVSSFGSILAFDDQQSNANLDVLLIGSYGGSDPVSGVAEFVFSHHKIIDQETFGALSVPAVIDGDVTQDGKTTSADVIAVANSVNGSDSVLDLDNDGVITAADVAIVLGNYGASSPVYQLLSDPSPILTRMGELTTGGGIIGPQPGGGTLPWEEPDCDDGGDLRPPYPGIQPHGQVCGTPPSPPCLMAPPTTDEPPVDPPTCDPDEEDDEDEEEDEDYDGECDSCTSTGSDCNGIVRLINPRYTGKGMDTNVSVIVRSSDWDATLRAVGNDPDDLNGVSDLNPRRVGNRIYYNIDVKDDFVGTLKFQWHAFNSSTGVEVVDCFLVRFVEYEPLPFTHAAFIPCEIVLGPSDFFTYAYFEGDDRVFCLLQMSLPEPFISGPFTWRAKYNLAIPCTGPILSSIPSVVDTDVAGEYQLGPYSSVVQPTFGRSFGYEIETPPTVLPTACLPLFTPLDCAFDIAPGAEPTGPGESQSASFDWDIIGGVVPGRTSLWPSTLLGRTNFGIVLRTAANKVVFRHRLSAKLPLFELSPPIDMKIVGELKWIINATDGKQSVQYTLDIQQDGYPAHEVYIGSPSTGTLKSWYDPLPVGADINKLFPGLDVTKTSFGLYSF